MALQPKRAQGRQIDVSTNPPALRGRTASVAAAALIGIGLTVFLQQAIGFDGPGLFFLALGAGFYAAYVNQRRRSNLIVPAGILSGLGLGVTLSSNTVLAHYLHAPLLFGSLALGFVAIYVFGEPHQRWALWPATGAGVIAWLAFVTSAPWLKDTFGAVAHLFWPLVLVAGGLWLLQRSRRLDIFD